MKGALPLGIVVDANVDKSVNGCVVKSVCSKKAVGRDSRIQVSTPFLEINRTCLVENYRIHFTKHLSFVGGRLHCSSEYGRLKMWF